MPDAVERALAGQQAYLVGGVVRDELLGRPIVDVDIACEQPERVARSYARETQGALFALSERHGAWRIALQDGRTVDFTPLAGRIEDNLATRDFTVNAIARPIGGGDPVDPFGGRADLEARLVRAVSPAVFAEDPLRLLRAVRLEDELGFRLEPRTERLLRREATRVLEPAGERILAELGRLSVKGFLRLGELGLLEQLGGSIERLGRIEEGSSQELLLVATLGESLGRLPISNDLRRFARTLLRAAPPPEDSPRAIHRFRRATEPWALEALAYLGLQGRYGPAVQAARERDPAQPLVRGDELGLPLGPLIGLLLAEIEEERAAGAISSREQALVYAARRATDLAT